MFEEGWGGGEMDSSYYGKTRDSREMSKDAILISAGWG